MMFRLVTARMIQLQSRALPREPGEPSLTANINSVHGSGTAQLFMDLICLDLLSLMVSAHLLVSVKGLGQRGHQKIVASSLCSVWCGYYRNEFVFVNSLVSD